jgi:AP-3 complex subunit delta
MSKNQYEAGLAINCLGSICTPDLARDLAPDLVSMLTSSRPYIRKRAVLVLYKIFLKFPEALRPAFPRLKEKLEDADPAVVCAAVNVICELARKNPANYIPLAPTLFRILTNSQNNWMLIKIIKLFGSLLPEEPRLAKRLIEPLTTLLQNTQAMSLLYECIQTCIQGLNQFEPVMKLCVAKLRMFVEHPDQNLKYLGLVAMHGIMAYYPKGVAEHRDLILGCLDDEDTTVRVRALELLIGMVNKKNLSAITGKLMEHVSTAEGSYRDDLIEKIINMISQGTYKHVSDFEWYIGVLLDMTAIVGGQTTTKGKLIRDQLLDVCMRVAVVRGFGVEKSIDLLREGRLAADNPNADGMCEALYAAAWILGEYVDAQEFKSLDLTEDVMEALDAMLSARAAAALPQHIQAVFLESSLKIFVKAASCALPLKKEGAEDEENGAGSEIAGEESPRMKEIIELFDKKLSQFTLSQHLEVQERACFLEALVKIYREVGPEQALLLDGELLGLIDEPMNPVSATAQSRVPLPEGLDLDTWINEPPPAPRPVSVAGTVAAGGDPSLAALIGSFNGSGGDFNSGGYVPGTYQPLSSEEIERRKAERASRQGGNIYMLGGSVQAPLSPTGAAPALNPAELGLPSDFKLADDRERERGRSHSSRSSRHHHGSSGSSRQHSSSSRRSDVKVMTQEDTPDGLVEVKSASKGPTPRARPDDDPLGQISLADIKDTETLQHRQHRVVVDQGAAGMLLGRSNSKPSSPAPSDKPREESRGSSGRHSGSGSSSRLSGSSKPSSSSSSSSEDKRRKLFSDDNVGVYYEVAPAAADQAVVTFFFSNRGKKLVFSIEIEVHSPAWARPADAAAEGPVSLSFTLPADPKARSQRFEARLTLPSTMANLTVPTSVSYMVGDAPTAAGAEGSSAEHVVKKELPLVLFASSFIKKTPIDQENFVKAMKGPLSKALLATSINKCSISRAVRKIAPLFSMTVLEETPQRSSMYGYTVAGAHVAVLIKEEGGRDMLALAVRCSDETLCQSLIDEINAMFK